MTDVSSTTNILSLSERLLFNSNSHTRVTAQAMTSPTASECQQTQVSPGCTFALMNDNVVSPVNTNNTAADVTDLPELTSLTNNNCGGAVVGSGFKPQFAAPLLFNAINKNTSEAIDCAISNGGTNLSPATTIPSPMSVMSSSCGDPSPDSAHAHAPHSEAFCYTPSPTSASVAPVRHAPPSNAAPLMTSPQQTMMSCASAAPSAAAGHYQALSAFAPPAYSRPPLQHGCVPISPVIAPQQTRFNPPAMPASGCRVVGNYPAFDQNHQLQQPLNGFNSGYMRLMNGALPPDPAALPVMPRAHSWAQELEIDVSAPAAGYASGKRERERAGGNVAFVFAIVCSFCCQHPLVTSALLSLLERLRHNL